MSEPTKEAVASVEREFGLDSANSFIEIDERVEKALAALVSARHALTLATQRAEAAEADKTKRDEAIVGYGCAVILTAYATHVNEYRLTRPEYAEARMREVLTNVDRYMDRDAARTGAR